MDTIQQFQQGDRKAFEQLFDELFHRLCAFANRYVSDSSEVEDIVQEAFVALWHQRERFNHELSIRSFLYTTVKNKCLNNLKHRTVTQQHESALIIELESQGVEHVMIEEDYYGQLYHAIRQLPEACQQIMWLALKGFNNPEIAQELGISENTVKTQKKIAYAKLRTQLKSVFYSFLF